MSVFSKNKQKFEEEFADIVLENNDDAAELINKQGTSSDGDDASSESESESKSKLKSELKSELTLGLITKNTGSLKISNEIGQQI